MTDAKKAGEKTTEETVIPEVNFLEIPCLAAGSPHSMYPFFDRMRELSPAIKMRTPEDRWISFLRAKTAKRILADTKMFKTFHPDAQKGGYFQEELLPASKDPPEHAKYRALLQKSMPVEMVRSLEPQMRAIATDLIDQILPQGRCDAIEAFAGRYPALVFFEMMRFPMEDFSALMRWEKQFWTSAEKDPEGGIRFAGLKGLKEYVRRQVRLKRAQPDASPLAELCHQVVDGRPLTEDEIVSFGVLLCIGGMHTTASLLGKMIHHLARRPDHRALLRDTAIIPRFIEEALRTNAIGESFRFVAEDTTIDGCSLKRGDKISINWVAVNRDGRLFPNPTQMRLEGLPPKHMGFGYGAHFCIGAPLARISLVIALEEWLARIPHYKIEDGAPLVEEVWGGSGLKTLPIVWK